MDYTEILRKIRSEIIAQIKSLVKGFGKIVFAENTADEFILNYDLAVGYPDSEDYYPTVVAVTEDKVILDNGYGYNYEEPLEGKNELSVEDLAEILKGCSTILLNQYKK